METCAPQVNITISTRSDLDCTSGKCVHSGSNSAIVARFWANVRREANGCWEWTASRFGGTNPGLYGQFTLTRDGKQAHLYAHRFSWELAHGLIPTGLCVLHACDNGICVNPEHLFLGTHTDNMRDAASKRRLSVSRPKGHKITDAQVVEIRARAACGVRQCVLVREYGVSKTLISLLLRWKRRQYGPPRQRVA